MINRDLPLSSFTYNLPDERIAKFPLEERDNSKLLLFGGGEISHTHFHTLSQHIKPKSLLVCNNTKVIRARIMFFKSTGAKIEIFCLEPHSPADYERVFSTTEGCQWSCLIGGRKKWKSEPLKINFDHNGTPTTLTAELLENRGKESIVAFSWDNGEVTFGDILHTLGTIPIPPYLERESNEEDNTTYQTVYSKIEGSVAAPTAGLHFTPKVLESLREKEVDICELTLHVGAGTFLPVKSENASDHTMHIEHFDVTLENIKNIIAHLPEVVAVGTTSVRTIESLSVLGYRALKDGCINPDIAVGQWEAYDIPRELSGKQLLSALVEVMEREQLDKLSSSTGIMIVPSYDFKVVKRLITNFHQPQSTLLLLINAVVGERWREIYDYALNNDFRFLSYGDSSILDVNKEL